MPYPKGYLTSDERIERIKALQIYDPAVAKQRKREKDERSAIKKKIAEENRQKKQREKDERSVVRKKIVEDPEYYTRTYNFWYGSVEYSKSHQYCGQWASVNARTHAFNEIHNGGRCLICGKHPKAIQYNGHHVYYVKKACCVSATDGYFYTNLNSHDHKEHDYVIRGDPDKFVIVCGTCHMKFNGGFENRKKWADYFTDMIITKWGGKCYLTVEEMVEYTGDKNWITNTRLAIRRWNHKKNVEINGK